MPTKSRFNTRPKVATRSLRTLAAAVTLAFAAADASAAGLGKLTVLSSLGQPLRAEIELTAVSGDEANQLMPKLASADAFKQANVDLNPVLYSLRFTVEQRGGKPVILVTSGQPINEPFVDMLIELGGNGSGRLVREYTFLLDPAELRSAQTAPAATSSMAVPSPAPAVQEALPAPRTPAPAAQVAVPSVERGVVKSGKPERAAKSAAAAPTEKTAPTDYRVKNGDSLTRIANQVKSEGVSLDQMLVALFRANPQAFMGNNMNRLRAGEVLSVPDAGTAGAVADGEARSMIVAQAADFNEYRNKLAGQVANTAPQPSAENKQSAAGKITAKVEEKSNVVAESKDKLKLSKAGATGGGIQPGEEDKIAREKATAEANARVKDLEKNVADLQKLIELKNKNLAEQQKAEAAKPAVQKPAAPAPVAAPAAPAAASAAAAASAPASPPAVAAASAPETKAEAPAPAPKPAVKPKPKAPPPPPPSLMDTVLGNPMILAGAAVVVGGLGLFGVMSRRRKQKSFGDSILDDSALKANSLFGSTGGQSVDTNNSMFNSSFSPAANQLDTNEVDPVAEADVYIAYGRDAQAEEILKEALRTQPDRHAVRVKLLEIYAHRKDLRSFEVMASELYAMTKGEGKDWQQAAALGASLDPNNPLYAGGQALSAEEAPVKPPLDEDLSQLISEPEPEEEKSEPMIEIPAGLGAEPAHEAAPVVHEPEPVAEKEPSLDFDLDGLGASSAPVEKAPEAPAHMDFDLGELAPAAESAPVAKAPAEPEPLPDLEIPSLHVPEVAHEAVHEVAHEPAPAAAPAPATLDFDLSGISLELNPAEKAAEKHEEHAPMADLHVPEIAALDMAPHEPAPGHAEPESLPDLGISLDTGGDGEYTNSAEMATKLDLAAAYHEIGDKEGARELLDEVIKGGTPEQTEKAHALLAKLG